MAVVRARIGRLPGGAGLGDAVAREPGQRRGRPLRRLDAAGALSARRAAGHRAPSTCAATPPEPGRWLSPPLVAAITETLGARRAGAAVPQPPRLCAADALPRLRPPVPVPTTAPAWLVEHRFRGRWSATIAAITSRSPTACPACGAVEQPGRLRAGRRAHRRGGGARCSRGAHAVLSSDLARRRERLEARDRGDRRGRGRHRHRHPARRQGPQLSDADAGRGGRRRSRPAAAAICARRSGPSSCCRQVTGRAGRAGAPSLGAAADLPARASGDAGDGLRRRARPSIEREIADASAAPAAAVRPAGGDHRSAPAARRRPRAMPAGSAAPRRRAAISSCLVPPRRRSR